jgi:hypothetical protein
MESWLWKQCRGWNGRRQAWKGGKKLQLLQQGTVKTWTEGRAMEKERQGSFQRGGRIYRAWLVNVMQSWFHQGRIKIRSMFVVRRKHRRLNLFFFLPVFMVLLLLLFYFIILESYFFSSLCVQRLV